MNEFKVKSYSKSELGQLYAPNCSKGNAWRVVNNWIDHCKPLQESLRETGLTINARILSPHQVSIIVEYLGEP